MYIHVDEVSEAVHRYLVERCRKTFSFALQVRLYLLMYEPNAKMVASKLFLDIKKLVRLSGLVGLCNYWPVILQYRSKLFVHFPRF